MRSVIARVGLSVLLIIAGAVGWTAFRLWRSWDSLPRTPFDLEASQTYLDTLAITPEESSEVGEPPPDLGIPLPAAQSDRAYEAFLAVGNETQFGGSRADVILLFLMPNNGADPALVSLPRDLYIESPCTQKFNRINAALAGCGDEVSGPELLAITVQQFTGIRIDHFAMFDFEGFKKVIDRVGGIEICVPNQVRDTNEGLQYFELPAGCTVADGAQALGWVRSRHTIEFVDGRWRSVAGVSDLTRNARQQDVLLQMLHKLKHFNSVGDLLDTAESLADAFTIDEELSLREAVELAWDMRDLDAARIHRLEIPVANHTTSGGAQVLLPQASFTEVLAQAYPEASLAFDLDETE